jgi:hypothetical protein
MKTKTIELWCDIYPGWQDVPGYSVCLFQQPHGEKPTGCKRIKVLVEMPCFGGSAELDTTVMARSEIVGGGLVR